MSDELKRRARRRLIGAIVIALTAALVLPMIMDSEPRRPDGEIDVRIPAPEALGPMPVPKSPATSTQASAQQAPTPHAEPAGSASTPAAARSVEAESESSKGSGAQALDRSSNSVSPQSSLPAARTDKPEVQRESPKKSPVAEKPAAAKVVRADDDRRARNILEAGSGSYVVQLGAFTESANVRRVEERVRKLGYPVYSEAVRGGKTRVRAGPFSSREDAQAARDKLAHAGLAGMVAEK